MPPTDAELLDLAERVESRCRETGWTLATAESCTGGLVAHLLTEVPGSSACFRGALVTYANDSKVEVAGVPEATLASHGAVSAQVAVAMAEGARQRLRADVGIGVTGIAGPGGGTAAKPVGLTYVAVADANGHDVRRYTWTEDRAGNKRASAEAALILVLGRIGEGPGKVGPSDTTGSADAGPR
ncbi:MAG: CinA family protein [Chloroflexota bacterium]|nr:CinA family protein [Chloroflexota bacterium]